MDNGLIFPYNLYFAQAKHADLEDANCDFGQSLRNLMTCVALTQERRIRLT